MTKRLANPQKAGRRKELQAQLSREIVNMACNAFRGPLELSRRLGITHAHLCRARIGEDGISRLLARKMVKLLGDQAKPDWIKL